MPPTRPSRGPGRCAPPRQTARGPCPGRPVRHERGASPRNRAGRGRATVARASCVPSPVPTSKCCSASSKRRERGRQDAQAARHRAEGGLDRSLCVAPFVGEQDRVEARRRRPHRRGSAHTSAAGSCRTATPRRGAPGPDRVTAAVEDGARVPLAAELGVEVRQRALNRWRAGYWCTERLIVLLELREPALLAAEHEQREPLGDRGVPALGPPAAASAPAISSSACSKRPSMSASIRPQPAKVPSLRRLAQLVGEAAERVELDVDAGAIAERPERVQAVVVTHVHPLLVAELLGQRDQLVNAPEAAVRRCPAPPRPSNTRRARRPG